MRLHRLRGGTPAGGGQVEADPDGVLDLDDPGAGDRLRSWYRPPRPDWLRVNLVVARNGDATGDDGTSGSITGGADRRILLTLRSLANAVLMGAATFRAETDSAPKRARLVLVTASGSLGDRMPDLPHPPLVLAPSDAADGLAERYGDGIEVVPFDGPPDAPGILAALHERGLRSIVCEGGPRLARDLIRGGVVDEVCLTTAPLEHGAGDVRFDAGVLEGGFGVEQLLADDAGYRYARYLRAAAPATA